MLFRIPDCASVNQKYTTDSEFTGRTETRHAGKLSPPQRNVVDWGGEFTPDQRLSGLARERSERTQCQAKKQTSRALATS